MVRRVSEGENSKRILFDKALRMWISVMKMENSCV